MLAGALFYVALIATIAMTFLSAGLAMVRTAQIRAAQTYVNAGFERAEASLRETLAARIAAGGPAYPLPAFTPIPPSCADGSASCAYRTSETIELTQNAPAASGASCDPAQSNCAQNEQANAYVDESRSSARIRVTVATAGGIVLATRARDVVLRAIDTPPYVITAGARDGSFDDAAATQAPGDDGGALPATPNPCATPVPGVADDTAIRVAYRNAATNACSNGGSWRASSYTIAGAPAAGWSP